MQNHRLRPAARFRRRTLALLAFSALAAAQLVSGATGAIAPAGTTSATNLRAPVINQQLVDQLQANPTGGVTAIVTTWNRDGLDDVAALGVTGTRLKVLPMVITTSLTSAQLDGLKASPAVRSVWPQERYETLMEDSTWITKARYVWSSTTAPGGPKGYGITGAGIELGLIDTGFDGLHEDGDNLIEYCDTTNLAAGSSSRMDVSCTPWVSTYNTLPAGACGAASPGPELSRPGGTCTNKARGDSLDHDVSHGSHVGGTMVGTGDASGGRAASHSTIGMAPDAKLRVYSANVGPSLLNTQTLTAYDDMTYKKVQGYSKVVAVNNSWGGTGGATYNPADPTAIAVKRAYDAGIVSVFAAGNSGPEHNTLSPQCIIPWVVCVAASTKPDSVVAFSSKGRPSQPSDTNRDGVIDANDVPSDNHDRLLGQKLGIGLYRPTLTAPGVNINSMMAFGADIGSPEALTCREDDYGLPSLKTNCYVQANGTSMATPHVTGAIGLIAQAFQQKRGRLPKPAEVIDILERSANTAKLPGWETEEQGAGRLDVHQAVRYAKGDVSLPAPNFGYPTPPYVAGSYGSSTGLKGCTQVGSWSARGTAEAPFYGQHFITVPAGTERIRLTVTWPNNTGANLYGLLWRPGVNPDASGATPDASGRSNAYHQSRAWPDQEGTGIPTGAPPTYRLVEVRAPEETDTGTSTAIPPGKWILRVYDRTPGANATGCGVTQETPQVGGRTPGTGYEYDVKVELPQVTQRPSIKITSPLTGIQTSRIVAVDGRASYPPEASDPLAKKYGYSWEGITNWAVPGSAQSVGETPENDTRTVLYLHGNTEEGCTGNGEADLVACDGPFLLPKTQLSAATAAFWRTGIDHEALDGSGDRTVYDPSWSWCLAPGDGCPTTPPETGIPAGPQTVGGPMTLEWWAQCNLCGGIFSADWNIRVWADGVLKFEQRVGASPLVLGEPGRVSATVALPTFTATQRIVIHIDPVYVDAQTVTFVYYDSESPCNALAPAGTRCDSLVRMPVGGGDSGSAPTPPQNIRVTDLPSDTPLSHPYPASKTFKGLRVAWDPQSPAPERYELYRGTDPVFPNGGTKIKGTFVDCVSPQAPTPGQPAGHDRQGLCYTDTHVNYGTVYYYRVVSVRKNAQGQDVRSSGSEIAYGMPTKFDRQVKVKVDRLYGQQYWENALVGQSPTPPDTENNGTTWTFAWDTQELVNGTYTGFPGPAFTLVPGPHVVSARTFTQGIGSTKDVKPVTLDDRG